MTKSAQKYVISLKIESTTNEIKKLEKELSDIQFESIINSANVARNVGTINKFLTLNKKFNLETKEEILKTKISGLKTTLRMLRLEYSLILFLINKSILRYILL